MHRAYYNAVLASLSSVGVAGTINESIDFTRSLFPMIKSGDIPAYMHRWLPINNAQTPPGFPSFAFMLSNPLQDNDSELKDLVVRGDSKGAEQRILDQAYVCPVLWGP